MKVCSLELNLVADVCVSSASLDLLLPHPCRQGTQIVVSYAVPSFAEAEQRVSVATFPVTGLRTGLSVSVSPLGASDSELVVSFGKVPLSHSDE